MTFIRIKATAIQAIFEYTNPIWCPIKNQYEVMIQNLIYRTILHLLEFCKKSDLY